MSNEIDKLLEKEDEAKKIIGSPTASEREKEDAWVVLENTKRELGVGLSVQDVSRMSEISEIENDDERERAYDKLLSETDATT